MMKTRNFFMMLAVALLWCGCSASDDESGASLSRTDENDARLIKASASATDVTVSPATRVVFEAEEFTNELVRVVGTMNGTDEGTYSDPYYCSGFMKFNAADVAGFETDAFNGKRYYPESGEVWLSGLYPETWDVTSPTACTANVDGKSDLMYAGSKKSTIAASATLQFGHLLTLLKISAKKSAEDLPITLETIKLTGTGAEGGGYVNNKCKVNLNKTDDPKVTFSEGTDGTSIFCYIKDTNVSFENLDNQPVPTATAGAEEFAYVLAPALTADEVDGDADYTLEVTYKISATGTSITKPVPLNLQAKSGENWVDFDADTAGKSFAIELDFKGVTIKAKATITAWDLAGKAEGKID
jgi:hypothetical protein